MKDVDQIVQKKTLIGVLTIFFAVIGIDQFMMGFKEVGKKTIIKTVILCIIPIVGWVINFIREIKGIIRGIDYLKMSEEDFRQVVETGPEYLK